MQIYPVPQGLCQELSRYDTILFAEDAITTGGIGEHLALEMQRQGWKGRYLLRGVNNRRLLHANVAQLRTAQGIDAASLAEWYQEEIR